MRLRALLPAAILLACATGFVSPRAVERPASPALANLSRHPVAVRDTILTGRVPQRVGGRGDDGAVYTTPNGETVSVRLSDRYPDDPSVGQAWANFLGALVHGEELASVRMYVAPLTEVKQICGQFAAACYIPFGQRMIVPGEFPGRSRATVEDLAAHEYGHHVAFNRRNDPWKAVDWGTKRWSSYLGICRRVAAGTVFPGDESDHYELNPGEGFAEVYRWLNAERAGRADRIPWVIVDRTFFPDARALDLVSLDVTERWAPTTERRSGRFSRRGAVARWAVATPHDGTVTIRASARAAAIRLLDARGTLLARGSHSVTYSVCGGRSLRVAVTGARTGAFAVSITKP